MSEDNKVQKQIGLCKACVPLSTEGKAELYKNPLHPYSKALLSAIPIADPTIRRDKIILDKEINFNEYKEGCRFADRCWMAKEDCHCITPELKDKGNNHYVACHYI